MNADMRAPWLCLLHWNCFHEHSRPCPIHHHGAGVHGLSTAYHLAQELKTRRKGSGADILVVDKTGIGAGASGIACGVIRNNYFQPAMRELMAHMRGGLGERSGGIQLPPRRLHADQPRSHAQGRGQHLPSNRRKSAIPRNSSRAKPSALKYMKGIFSDWQAKGITSVLAREEGRVREQSGSMQGAGRQGPERRAFGFFPASR